MKRPRILCISFSDISTDARVLRQVEVLKNHGSVTTLSYGGRPDLVDDHLEIDRNLPSLPQTLSGVAKLALRRYKSVVLEAPAPALGGASPLENAHESVLRTEQGVDPTGGYHGSLQAGSGTDPVLAALQEDLEGTYVGDGVTVVEDVVVVVGRKDLR